MDYITLQEASRKIDVTYMALYSAVGRKSLKAVKRNGVLNTTMGWIGEYQKNLRNKELRSRFNGKKTFDEALGEFSTKRVTKMLGIPRNRLFWLIYTGQIKTMRKGCYHIITQNDIDNYINKTETIVTETVA